MLFEISDEPLAVARARVAAAERVELERDVFEAERAPQPRAHHDMLDVDVRTRKAQRFDADLVKLPRAPFLRTLVPEHRPAIPESLRRVVQQVVLDRRTHARRGAFRPQREALAIEAI